MPTRCLATCDECAKMIEGIHDLLSPVHTSNNVEATGNFVACCFGIVASVDRALLLTVTPPKAAAADF